MGSDPHYNDLSLEYSAINGPAPMQRARMRNKRGEYVSLQPGSSLPMVPNTADAQEKRVKLTEVKKAEQRLRRIEMISKYREEKIKREFMKLEEDLRAEDERK